MEMSNIQEILASIEIDWDAVNKAIMDFQSCEQLPIFQVPNLYKELESTDFQNCRDILKEHGWPTAEGFSLYGHWGGQKSNLRSNYEKAKTILNTPVTPWPPGTGITYDLVNHPTIQLVAKILAERSYNHGHPSQYFAECAWDLLKKIFPHLSIIAFRENFHTSGSDKKKIKEWCAYEIVSRAMKIDYIYKLIEQYPRPGKITIGLWVVEYWSGKVYKGQIVSTSDLQPVYPGTNGFDVAWVGGEYKGSIWTHLKRWTVVPDDYDIPEEIMKSNPQKPY